MVTSGNLLTIVSVLKASQLYGSLSPKSCRQLNIYNRKKNSQLLSIIFTVSKLFGIIDAYIFSGVPSNAVYDLIKKAWQKINHKTWEELYIEAFKATLNESRPYLSKYAAEDGSIEIDETKISQFLNQDFNIGNTTFSEINGEEFISQLSRVAAEHSILIIGGHQLTDQDYSHIIRNLIEQVRISFKESVISDEKVFNRVLLEESI